MTEGDESDRSIELLRPAIAVLTNVDLDHHAPSPRATEVEELFERWLAGAAEIVRGDELEPVDFELAVPGEHNRRNAAAALAALELVGRLARRGRARCSREFAGAGRRFELHGEAAGVAVDQRLRRTIRRRSARRSRRRASVRTAGECSCSSSRSATRGRGISRSSSARSLAAADAVAVADVSGAERASSDGVSGKLVVDALCRARVPGCRSRWTPALSTRRRSSPTAPGRRRRPGPGRRRRGQRSPARPGSARLTRPRPWRPCSFVPPGALRALPPLLRVARKFARVVART